MYITSHHLHHLCIFLAQKQTHQKSFSFALPHSPRPVFNCGGDLVGDSGFVGSEGFPSFYKPNSKCTWYITVPEGNVVMLSFRIFDLEADPLCRYDYVDVYNGHSNMVQKLGRFCGTFRPGALISTSNTMMVEMVSDSGTGGRGFLAYFNGGKPHHQFCGGKLTKSQGTIKTPNWPEKNYPVGISCSWLITVEPEMVRKKHNPTVLIVFKDDIRFVMPGADLCWTLRKYINFALWISPWTTRSPARGRHMWLPQARWTLLRRIRRPPLLTQAGLRSLKPASAHSRPRCVRLGSMQATVSLIKAYTAGSLTITQAGETMSVKLLMPCKKCPLLRRGQNYILMGHVDEEGRGVLTPGSFTALYKAPHHKILTNINNQAC
uniref:Procollagen C-endopeptidase enhancer a n=1 Tax=Sinocyclocheilus rhinocerous TaxID=307959 RepID=A0A673LBF7_9TELE